MEKPSEDILIQVYVEMIIRTDVARVFIAVFFVSRRISQTDAATSTKHDVPVHSFAMSSGNLFVSGSKVRVSHKEQCWRGSLHSCDCWPLLVMTCVEQVSAARLHCRFRA